MTGVPMDELLSMLKDDLIEMLIIKGNLSEKVGKEGSAPTGIDKLRYEAPDNEESLSSSYNFDSSSSSIDGAGSGDSVASSG